MKLVRVKIRNLAAKSPLLRKGGVHDDRRHRRTDERKQVADALLAWQEEPLETEVDKEGGSPARRRHGESGCGAASVWAKRNHHQPRSSAIHSGYQGTGLPGMGQNSLKNKYYHSFVN